MEFPTLTDLGWSDAYSDDPKDHRHAQRVTEVHRTAVSTLSPEGEARLDMPRGTTDIAVGDWITLRDATPCVLPRRTLIARRAAGEEARQQLIAANVDTLAIVTSCNADFNTRRLERYLVMAEQSGALPLIVLTKADLTDDPEDFRRRADRLSPLVTAITVDATDTEDAARLEPWCKAGQTLALAGSSGVGKTTLRNALCGDAALVRDIRDDDAKGRHTTTSRQMLRTRAGGWLIDTPGMRELRLTDAADGIGAVFADIEALAKTCRFNDCAHETEPGCAVKAAVDAGTVTPERVDHWRKLSRENEWNTATVAERNAKAKSFGKLVKTVKARKRFERGD